MKLRSQKERKYENQDRLEPPQLKYKKEYSKGIEPRKSVGFAEMIATVLPRI